MPERSERHQTQIPPLNPEERGMSWPHLSGRQKSPNGDTLTRLVIYSIYRLLYIKSLYQAPRETRSPAGSGPCDIRQGIAKSTLATRYTKEYVYHIRGSSANAHTIRLKRNSSSRQLQTPQSVLPTTKFRAKREL